MIKFFEIEDSDPYCLYKNLYKKALAKKQKNIEAVCISSFNFRKNEVDSRYVNLKYIKKNKWYFYTNYKSQKSKDFESHNQVSATFFWHVLNIQIRIKAKIYKASTKESDQHFINRKYEKNVLAVSSNQSKKIESYEAFKMKYKKNLKDFSKKDLKRPDYWGGYYIVPYYFEFWEGNENRLNKRKVFEISNNQWLPSILEP